MTRSPHEDHGLVRPPRATDLYDLWDLARTGALTSSAAELFATHTQHRTATGAHVHDSGPRLRIGGTSCPDRHASQSARRKHKWSSARPGRLPDTDRSGVRGTPLIEP